MSDTTVPVHVARPKHIGSWTFHVQEENESGDAVAEVVLTGLRDQGALYVGAATFQMLRDGLSRSYDLVFEGLRLARAEIEAPILGSTYEIGVDQALLADDVASGPREAFTLESKVWGNSSARLLHEGRVVGSITRESVFMRHFTLQFEDSVPLVLRAFCFGLVLARMRRQSRNG